MKARGAPTRKQSECPLSDHLRNEERGRETGVDLQAQRKQIQYVSKIQRAWTNLMQTAVGASRVPKMVSSLRPSKRTKRRKWKGTRSGFAGAKSRYDMFRTGNKGSSLALRPADVHLYCSMIISASTGFLFFRGTSTEQLMGLVVKTADGYRVAKSRQLSSGPLFISLYFPLGQDVSAFCHLLSSPTHALQRPGFIVIE